MFPETLQTGTATRPPPAVPSETIMRLSVDQYHDMIRNGILTEDDPVELLDGWLVSKMARNPPHRVVNGLLQDKLATLVGPNWHINTQEAVTLDISEPEPDVSVVRGNRLDYRERNPAASEIGMLVEISDTSLTRDRGFKKRIYAQANVPIYWIVNLVDCVVEVYAHPSGPGEQPDYAQRQDYRPGDSIPVVLNGREVGRLAVQEFLV